MVKDRNPADQLASPFTMTESYKFSKMKSNKESAPTLGKQFLDGLRRRGFHREP
jgi:hypothetical protein